MSEPIEEAWWGIVEIMGHKRLGGYLSEADVAGATFLRVDFYDETGETALGSQFFAPSAVFSIAPCAKDVALAVGRDNVFPLQQWEFSTLFPKTNQEVVFIDENRSVSEPPF